VLNKLHPGIIQAASVNRRYSSKMSAWRERENIAMFLQGCRRLGIHPSALFETDDLYVFGEGEEKKEK
jgi:hypothetical protein